MSRTGENIYKRKDGRWEGRYIRGRKKDGSIHYGYVYRHSFRELRQVLFTFKLTYKDNYLVSYAKKRNSKTLSQWAIEWLAQQENIVRFNTYQSYRSKMTQHILPGLGNQSLDYLTTPVIQEWLMSLTKILSASSIQSVIRVLRTCLNQAVAQGFLAQNPATQVKLPQRERSPLRSFSKEEQEQLEAAMFQGNAVVQKFFPMYLSLYTGLRIGEVAGLQWSDIDWQDRTLHVQHSLQRIHSVEGQSPLQATFLKTKHAYRVIPLTTQIYRQLSQLKQGAKNAFIFHGYKHQALDPRTIRYRFKQLKELVPVRDLPFHALRHSFATRCIEANVSITTLSDLMGHQSTKMTLDTYTSSFLSEKRVAIQKISS